MAEEFLHPNICLGIPLPKSVRSVVNRYPEPVVTGTDKFVKEIIEKFGQDHKVPESEVQKCWQLASGYDDIVIMLTRPSKDHQYDDNFSDFVLRSPVLKAVDNLVRFASAEVRNVINVCILDVFSFKPIQRDTQRHYPSDLECHDLIERIIKIKKPRVIIGCCSEIAAEHWLTAFRAGGVGREPKTTVVEIDGSNCVVVPSFHPGHCINHVPWDAQSRILLIHHFLLAFGSLQGRSHPQPLGKSIVPFKAQSSQDKPTHPQACFRILQALRRIHNKDSRLVRWSVCEERLAPSMVDEIYDLLWTLGISESVTHALEIAQIATLWQSYFKSHPLYAILLAQIFAVGALQTQFVDEEAELVGNFGRLEVHHETTEQMQSSASVPERQEETFKSIEQKPTVEHCERTHKLANCTKAWGLEAGQLLKITPTASTQDMEQLCASMERLLKDYLKYDQEFARLVADIPVIFEGGQGVDDTEELGPATIGLKNVKSLFQRILEQVLEALKQINECKRLKDELVDMVRRELSPLVRSLYKGKESAAMPVLLGTLAEIDIRSPQISDALLRDFQTLIAMRMEMAGVKGLLTCEQPPRPGISGRGDAPTLFAGVYQQALLEQALEQV